MKLKTPSGPGFIDFVKSLGLPSDGALSYNLLTMALHDELVDMEPCPLASTTGSVSLSSVKITNAQNEKFMVLFIRKSRTGLDCPEVSLTADGLTMDHFDQVDRNLYLRDGQTFAGGLTPLCDQLRQDPAYDQARGLVRSRIEHLVLGVTVADPIQNTLSSRRPGRL